MKLILNIVVAVLSFAAAWMWFKSTTARVVMKGRRDGGFSTTVMSDGSVRTLKQEDGVMVAVEATAALVADYNKRAAICAGLAAALQGLISIAYP